MSRQIFDIFVCLVDDLRQLFSIDHLFKHIHRNFFFKLITEFRDICSDDFRNSRAPKQNSDQTNRSFYYFF